MERIEVVAPGKVNLLIDVGEKRPDGFHDVSMIMQAVALFDEITLEKKEDEGFTIEVLSADYIDKHAVPTDERNLMARAAKLMFSAFSLPGGLAMTLSKRIPTAAGLGGGSSDAAAVIFGINALYELGLTENEMESFSSLIGSDVPFFIQGGTQLATGRGEKLFPLPALTDYELILGNPRVPLSTAAVYQAMDDLEAFDHPDANAAASAILSLSSEEDGSYDREKLDQLLQGFRNVLELAAFKLEPKVELLKEKIAATGPVRTLMSGSGASVFGIYRTKNEAENAYRTLAGQDPDLIWIGTELFPVGVRIRNL